MIRDIEKHVEVAKWAMAVGAVALFVFVTVACWLA
jgi:hypothetical protein